MIHPLSQEERNRFAAWLEQEVKTDHDLVSQMEKLGSAFAPMIALRKAEITAASHIARKLRAIQEDGLRN